MRAVSTGLFALAAIWALACAPAANADELPSSGGSYTFNFQGQCGDCTGYGTGVLQVQDYVLGTALTNDNLVDFKYDSNLTSFDINPASDDSSISLDTLSGSINTSPGPYNIDVAQNLFLFTLAEFTSNSNGSWDAQQEEIDLDHGTNGTWNGSSVSAAPEPATWALMMLGIGGIGYAFRRAKRKHGFRFKDAFAA